MDLFFTILRLVVGIGLLLLTARQARRAALGPVEWTRFLWLWGLLLGCFTLNALLQIAVIFAQPRSDAQATAILTLVVTLAGAAGLWLLVARREVRARLAVLFPARRAQADFPPGTPWEQQVRGFDPDSAVHAYALGLILQFFLSNVVSFIVAGGQAGLASGDLSQGSVLLESGLSLAILLSVTLLGAGLGADRSRSAVLARLGLRRPTQAEVFSALGIVAGMLAFIFVAGMVQVILTPPELLEEQTRLSRAIVGSVNSLAVGFLIALFTGVGEEIAFRGGMQPVFGLWPTALLFAATHIQYQFTLASLIIFGVALALGYARHKYGTAAAILAHFSYNFALLALNVAASQMPLPGG